MRDTIDLNWQSSEYEWIELVRQLLLELARACLGDLPKLPMHVAQQARPMAETAGRLLDEARSRGIVEAQWQHYPELAWTHDARKLFLELAQVYLSDLPKLPENASIRALDLAERAQTLLEQPMASASDAAESPPLDTTPPPTEKLDRATPSTLLNLLKSRLEQQRVHSHNPDAPEWQQLLNLLDVARGLYHNLKD
ncbi:hypothetical protein [Baaleninema simplex]|uniref:hypothetical protein n=1 Tax=Baaleninema simplex TaxID=2862350 RepID=UPI00034536BF|nr:hypothetical protein [Baaleninema simplex]